MSNKNLMLKKKIMRKVYAIWFFKKLNSSFVIQLAALLFLLLMINTYISFINVINNMPGLFSSSNFFIYAFQNTETTVKLMLVFVAILMLLVGRELIKASIDFLLGFRKQKMLNFTK